MFLRRIFWRQLRSAILRNHKRSVLFDSEVFVLIIISIYRPTNKDTYRPARSLTMETWTLHDKVNANAVEKVRMIGLGSRAVKRLPIACIHMSQDIRT